MAGGGKKSSHAAAAVPKSGDGEQANNTTDLNSFVKSQDYANYFCTYSYLYHQKEMLSDHVRMNAYYRSVFDNQECFRDKVVLDVGAGSGILSVWAAKAGARKVYAIEATSISKHARTLVEHNGLSEIVTVMQTKVEDIESLPEPVDVIISEWMGYFLLRESMLDSVIVARDRFLRPGGALYPSHCTVYLAPCRTPLAMQRANELSNAMNNWDRFSSDIQAQYDVDLSCLRTPYYTEETEYSLQTSQWAEVYPSQLAGVGAPMLELDLNTCTVADIEVIKANVTMQISMPAGLDGDDEDTAMGEAAEAPAAEQPLQGIVGWFDVEFRGSEKNPAQQLHPPVVLSTAPDASGATHWGQQLFPVAPGAVTVRDGDVLHAEVKLERREENHRLLRLYFDMCKQPKGTRPKDVDWNAQVALRWNID